jgi:hypothetical protein
MKTSYLIPFLSVLSLGTITGCDAAEDTAGEPDAGTDPGVGCDVRYADLDGDRKGDPAAWTTACAPGPGWVDNSDDCDDTNPYINADETEICDGLDNDCRATTSEDEACTKLGCEPVVNPATKTSYLFCRTPNEPVLDTRAATGDVCDKHGFHPGQIEDAAEDAWLAQQLKALDALGLRKAVQLGGLYADGVWRWADDRQFWPDPRTGSAAPYANWAEGEPASIDGGECLVLDAREAPAWRSVACGKPALFLCER